MILNDASRNVGSLDQTLNCDSMNLHTSPDWRGTGNSIYFLKILQKTESRSVTFPADF